ncbi:hypothetical protein [Pseudoruegeria sp. HB172150]|uniref:hypothetical protein n=1 Tax=Pseudoruegeria sp. HB172150 TaxID=2721164 RepID=UPI0015532CA9|nr:hypothetical protein [Pseudoruegeria sp. HB172150]
MPGFITTKTGKLETRNRLKSKNDDASKYVDPDQLDVALQCGFASTERSNEITEDDEKLMLEFMFKTAEAIWGES